MGEITVLLQRAHEGDRAAFDELIVVLYPELHCVARARLGGHVRSTVMDTNWSSRARTIR